ncbi:MAG: nuclear transport factor 2 family protein, partial [Thermoanaerobaculia bacterium]
MGANAELIRRWFEEVWNQGRAESIDELLAPDAVIHGLVTGDLVGLQAFRAFHVLFRAAFYDIEVIERPAEHRGGCDDVSLRERRANRGRGDA